jgi:hypothetical protein
MAGTITKAGTGYGAVLAISSTAATLATPAPAPSATPTKYTLAPASTPTGIAILQLKTFSMPQQKWAFDDVTNVSSPTIGVGTAKESLLTLLDLGEFSAEGIFLPSDPGLVAVQTAFESGLPNQFQIQLGLLPGQSTSGNVYEFNAWVSSNPIPTNVSVDKAIAWKMDLKLATIMTITLGS